MTNLKTDSPLSRRIATSFLRFLHSVEPSPGVNSESLEVARECLGEVFKIDSSAPYNQSNCDSLIDIFSSREAIAGCETDSAGISNGASTSAAKNSEVLEALLSLGQDTTREQYSNGKDELFGQFFGALEKIHYFSRMPDGNDDQVQLDRATLVFHNAVQEMQIAGCQTFDQISLAETFKSQGNKGMQSKLYKEAIELYTFAIALCADNAVYFCNRAAAYTQIYSFAEAVQDCLKSIEINPNYSKAYSRLGFAYYAQGKYKDAIDKGFKKALLLDPTNNAVKENIRVTEQKLKEEQQRPYQNSASTSHGESSQQSERGSRSSFAAPPPFPSMPFNIDALPTDFASMLRNMSYANPGQSFETRPAGQSDTGAHTEPEIRIGGNINLDVNELPEEVSGAFRSVMEMFSGTSPQEVTKDSFAQKEAAAKAAKAEKRAAQRVAAKEKAQERKEAEARAAEEAKRDAGAPEMEGARKTTEAPGEEMFEDHVPLTHRKRKAVVDPETVPEIILIGESSGKGTQPTSPPSVDFSQFLDLSGLGPPETRGNIFLEGASGVGLRLLQGILSPAEEAHMKDKNAGDQLLEGFNRCLSSLQLVKSAFETMDTAYRHAEKRAYSSKALLDQLQSEMTLDQELHTLELSVVRSTLDGVREQLKESQLQRLKAEAKADEARARSNKLDLEARAAVDEAALASTKADEMAAALEARARIEKEWRTAFLASSEFKGLVEDMTFSLFKTGFKKCRDQLKEAGLLPPEKKRVLDFQRAIASLPAEWEEAQGDIDSDDESSGPEDVE